MDVANVLYIKIEKRPKKETTGSLFALNSPGFMPYALMINSSNKSHNNRSTVQKNSTDNVAFLHHVISPLIGWGLIKNSCAWYAFTGSSACCIWVFLQPTKRFWQVWLLSHQHVSFPKLWGFDFVYYANSQIANIRIPLHIPKWYNIRGGWVHDIHSRGGWVGAWHIFSEDIDWSKVHGHYINSWITSTYFLSTNMSTCLPIFMILSDTQPWEEHLLSNTVQANYCGL